MTIVFDENVPWPMRRFFPHHDVTSVQREGMAGSGNGELLALLDGRFDIFILCDKNLRYQQNLKERRIAIIELHTNRWPVLQELREVIVEGVGACVSGAYLTVMAPDSGEKDVGS